MRRFDRGEPTPLNPLAANHQRQVSGCAGLAIQFGLEIAPLGRARAVAENRLIDSGESRAGALSEKIGHLSHTLEDE